MKKLFLIPKLTFLFFFLIGSFTQINAQDPLMANWRLNNNADDETSLYNGTASTTFYYNTSCAEGEAAGAFVGADRNVITPSITLPDNFTITGWFKSLHQTNINRVMITNAGSVSTPDGF